jgi:transposase
MLSVPAAIKVYLCTVACDMRRSFDGLSMMAQHITRCNPFSGHLLVFCNKRSDRLKILYWDRDGWVIWYKRLEAPQGHGRQRLPKSLERRHIASLPCS